MPLSSHPGHFGTTRFPKRRSVSLQHSPRHQHDAWNDYSAPDSAQAEKHWEPTLQSLDEANLSPDTKNSTTMQEQEAEILRLTREVLDLREELTARPTEDEVYAMRMEWQTSEELFAQSQKDNEQKHNHIESLRQYVKALESKLEETLGEDWKEYCILPNSQGSSNTCGTSTPLPKPGKLRSSASIKRASRHSHTRGISAADARILREIETMGDKSTPAGALRALDGIRESYNGAPSSLGTNDANALSSSVNWPTPAEVVLAFESGSPYQGGGRMERSPSYHSTRATTPAATSQNEQLAALITTVKSLPSSLALQVEQALQREESHSETRREGQRQAILEVLDAAESRAEARELRLQGLLAEAKACSGHMEW